MVEGLVLRALALAPVLPLTAAGILGKLLKVSELPTC